VHGWCFLRPRTSIEAAVPIPFKPIGKQVGFIKENICVAPSGQKEVGLPSDLLCSAIECVLGL